MLSSVIALCAVVVTFSIARYFVAKSRLVDTKLDEIISQKLSQSEYVRELSRLREENGVMRNLLIDMVENEALPTDTAKMSEPERTRVMKARIQRRREVFGEALLTLKQTDRGRSAHLSSPVERA